MIDLHTHTNHSDGMDSVEELLKKAEEKKISYLSITDHNNCNSYKEIKEKGIRNLFSGVLIPGIELNTTVCKVTIELLGYGIDIGKMSQKLENLYPKHEEHNKFEMETFYQMCIDRGVVFDDDVMKNYDMNKYFYGINYLYFEILKKEENKDKMPNGFFNLESPGEFYRKFITNKNTELFIDTAEILPSVEFVCNMIRECGGLVFVPHIFAYAENSLEILNYILDNKLADGIECFHNTFSKEQTEFLLEICEKNNLLISGGSDYHGKRKKYVQLGTGKGNLNIEEKYVEKWIKNVTKSHF